MRRVRMRCGSSVPERAERRVWGGGLGGIAVVASGLALACAAGSASRGGWDASALATTAPQLAALSGQRLGDLTPYPALAEDARESGQGAENGERGADAAVSERTLLLVTCRWPDDEGVPVLWEGLGEREAWARDALRSLSDGIAGVDLRLVLNPVSAPGPRIEISTVAAEGSAGPDGVGDTWTECDMTRDGPGRVRGTVRLARIAMRPGRTDVVGRWRAVERDAWTGGLMHEIGHALGFQGHVWSDASLLSRSEDRLRRAGRAAARGEASSDATLEALYRLHPGRILERRPLAPSTRGWLRKIEEDLGEGARGPFAVVGDQRARLEWERVDGTRLQLVFPHWRAQLGEGKPILGLPTFETLERMR